MTHPEELARQGSSRYSTEYGVRSVIRMLCLLCWYLLGTLRPWKRGPDPNNTTVPCTYTCTWKLRELSWASRRIPS